jgi:hypothetical protein
VFSSFGPSNKSWSGFLGYQGRGTAQKERKKMLPRLVAECAEPGTFWNSGTKPLRLVLSHLLYHALLVFFKEEQEKENGSEKNKGKTRKKKANRVQILKSKQSNAAPHGSSTALAQAYGCFWFLVPGSFMLGAASALGGNLARSAQRRRALCTVRYRVEMNCFFLATAMSVCSTGLCKRMNRDCPSDARDQGL